MGTREQETVQDRPPAGTDGSQRQETDASSDESASERGLMMAAVSTAIVQIHKKCFGKGPVKASSYLSGNLLAVILEGGCSRGERTLQENGHLREMLSSRTALQDSMESEIPSGGRVDPLPSGPLVHERIRPRARSTGRAVHSRVAVPLAGMHESRTAAIETVHVPRASKCGAPPGRRTPRSTRTLRYGRARSGTLATNWQPATTSSSKAGQEAARPFGAQSYRRAITSPAASNTIATAHA